MNKNEKIQRAHQERAAIIYVRQSSMEQVRHNLESQRRQYELADLAPQLGFATVTVIDEDQGRSGSGSVQRTGFLRLLELVFQGQVGAVFALEASRLARNNRDWHPLVDLCAMAETIVIDHDGVYDPRLLHDRLLLGLKGTMSEFELGLLRQRAKEAFLAKVKRGVVMTRVPAGYIRTEDDRIERHPDRRVPEAIRAVFELFEQLGSARQVLLYQQKEASPPVCLLRLHGGGPGRSTGLSVGGSQKCGWRGQPGAALCVQTDGLAGGIRGF